MTEKMKPREKYEAVKGLTNDGMSVAEACEKVGYTESAYSAMRGYIQRHRLDKKTKRRKARYEKIVVPSPQFVHQEEPTFTISGSPEQLARFITTLKQGAA